jgi:hypothetical protein
MKQKPTNNKQQCEWVNELRPTVSLSWCQAPSGAHNQLLITIWLLLFIFQYRAPPLTRGQVCHLSQSLELLQYDSVNLLPALASILSISVFITPREKVAQLYPQALGSSGTSGVPFPVPTIVGPSISSGADPKENTFSERSPTKYALLRCV